MSRAFDKDYSNLVAQLHVATRRLRTKPCTRGFDSPSPPNDCSPRAKRSKVRRVALGWIAPKPTVIAAPKIGRIGVGMQTSLSAAMTMPQAADRASYWKG